MKKTKLLLPIVGLAGLAATIPSIVSCSCSKDNDEPAWHKYFDDPGEEERHQVGGVIGERTTFKFDLKEQIPEDEKIMGEGRVVKVSHEGVEAEINNVVLDMETRKAVSFDAAITEIPPAPTKLFKASNEKITYSADFEVEVQCKKTVGEETVWTTTIEELTLEIEVEATPGPTGNYLSIESDKSTQITINVDNGSYLDDFLFKDRIPNLKYWTDSGWQEVKFTKKETTSNENDEELWIATIDINESNDYKLYLKGKNLDGFSQEIQTTEDSDWSYVWINNNDTVAADAEWTLGGTPMALVNNGSLVRADSETIPADTCFRNLFASNDNIVEIENPNDFLPATTLKDWCYVGMFEGTGITTIPKIPSTVIPKGACMAMFSYCHNIVEITDQLSSITTVKESGFELTFSHCDSLKNIAPLNGITGLEYLSFHWMFSSCTALETPPVMPTVDELPQSCFFGMFQDCTALKSTPVLPATKLNENTYGNMFYNCTSLETINPITILQTNGDQCCHWMFALDNSHKEGVEFGPKIHDTGTVVLDLSNCVIQSGNSTFWNMFQNRPGNIPTPEKGKQYEFVDLVG